MQITWNLSHSTHEKLEKFSDNLDQYTNFSIQEVNNFANRFVHSLKKNVIREPSVISNSIMGNIPETLSTSANSNKPIMGKYTEIVVRQDWFANISLRDEIRKHRPKELLSKKLVDLEYSHSIVPKTKSKHADRSSQLFKNMKKFFIKSNLTANNFR